MCIVLDPEKVAEREKMRAVCGNLLQKYGVKEKTPGPQGVPDISDPLAAKPKGCGRVTGPPIKRKAMTKERKEMLKGAVRRRSSRFEH